LAQKGHHSYNTTFVSPIAYRFCRRPRDMIDILIAFGIGIGFGVHKSRKDTQGLVKQKAGPTYQNIESNAAPHINAGNGTSRATLMEHSGNLKEKAVPYLNRLDGGAAGKQEAAPRPTGRRCYRGTDYPTLLPITEETRRRHPRQMTLKKEAAKYLTN